MRRGLQLVSFLWGQHVVALFVVAQREPIGKYVIRNHDPGKNVSNQGNQSLLAVRAKFETHKA
jgi:hypothetical protein